MSTARQDTGRRRRRVLSVVAVLLLVVPIIEVAVIVAVGRVIGTWPTIALLVIESALGAWIVRREGGRTWQALSTALRTGRMPSRELADAALVLVGGTLLLAPGFVTDVVGFFLILPITRPVARRLLEAAVARRLLATTAPVGTPFGGPAPRRGGSPFGQGETPVRRGEGGPDRPGGTPPRATGSGEVVEGEIVEE